MMTFYMTPGSCSTGIHILLEELELVFSADVLNLPAGDGQKPEYLAINPKGTIPTLLLDDGTALTEFTAIAFWLAQRYPKANLLPAELAAQAKALEIVSDVTANIHGQGYTRIFTTDRYALREGDAETIVNQGKVLVQKGLRRMADHLQSVPGPWCFEHFTIADAALFYVEFWADRIDLSMPEACRKHYQAMCARPVVKRVLMEEGYRV